MLGVNDLPAPDGTAIAEGYSDFEGTTLFPMVVDGETYLGRIGYVGWRVSPNILLAVYDLVTASWCRSPGLS